MTLHPTPNQMHPLDANASRYSYQDHRKGLDTSFKKGDNLLDFAK